MGFCKTFTFSLFILGIAFVAYKFNESSDVSIPEIDSKYYWGPGSAQTYKESSKINKFSISYSAEVINDLKTQLARPLKLHDPLEGTSFEYGFNSKKLRSVIKYWREEYLPKWSQRQEFLNKFPQYKTQIQGLDIHFIRVIPNAPGKTVIPLLMIHGWPGSVREFYEIIPKLTTPNPKSNFVFEVIVPSLPGYGFSQAASKKGLGPAAIAIIFKNLMTRLGHDRFMVQGGDWGSLIISHIATLFPEKVIGAHSNMCMAPPGMNSWKLFVAAFYPSYFVEKHQEPFFFPVMKGYMYLLEETGYMHIQSTKPDTIGAALTDNPVGLAAYILEKFSTWTNPEFRNMPDGGLEKRFKMDNLLDNIMIYYLSNSITTSQRLYAESFGSLERGLNLDRVPTPVPYGCARFKHDMAHSMDCLLKDKYTNLIHSTYHLDGGHFAALELPDVLYNDFIQFVEKVYKH